MKSNEQVYEEFMSAETSARLIDAMRECSDLGCSICLTFPCSCNGYEDDGAEMLRPYHQAAEQIADLVAAKQLVYGNSFGQSGQVMRILYPHGIRLEQMDDALTVVRVLDKLFRVATDRDALGESPWRDIAGYALLSVVRGDQ